MRFTSTSGQTYELYCFEFYNRRFFCLGNLIGERDICEFVSSFDFKHLLIHNPNGKSTFKSNKSTVNPFLLHKNMDENNKFKNENYNLYREEDVDIEDYGPTSFNGRYTCIGVLQQLNIPDDAIFETFTIPKPKLDHWLIENDESYARIYKNCGRARIHNLYCAMPFLEIYDKIKILHCMTKDKKHYFDINSLGVILSADMGTTENNGFKRLNAFCKLSPAAGIKFCSIEFMLSSRIDKLIEVADFGNKWIIKHGRDIPMDKRRKQKFSFRFFYEYIKKFRWALSEKRSADFYKANFITSESGKKVRIAKPSRDFMYKLIFSGETMNEFRLYRFEQVDKANLASDPGFNGADLTNVITHWPSGDSWYIDGHLDLTDPKDFVKLDGFTKTKFIYYMKEKYSSTATGDLYELFRNWLPSKFINELHFFNIKMNPLAYKLSDRDKEYGSLNTGFIRFYHFDSEYYYGTYVSLAGILATFGCHHAIAKEMVGNNEFDREALGIIPGLRNCIFHKIKTNEFGLMTPDSYAIQCRDDEYPRQLNTIVMSVPEALQFINNGLYQNSRELNAHWRKNANSLFTAFPEVTISSRIKGHSMNELYGNIPKLTF